MMGRWVRYRHSRNPLDRGIHRHHLRKDISSTMIYLHCLNDPEKKVARGADAPRFMLSLPPQLNAVTLRGSFHVPWPTSIDTFDQRSKVLCPPGCFPTFRQRAGNVPSMHAHFKSG